MICTHSNVRRAHFGNRLNLKGVAGSTIISHASRIGRLTSDVGPLSQLLVQIEGTLASPTSGVAGIGINTHVSTPFWLGGTPESPRQAGVFLGGETQALVAVQSDMSKPSPQLRRAGS